ncbi:hypothetical protein [Amycolatopsis sp. DG1A-15b]|uniref:hypothetical protein n=1 Tax=Amycolatopsis sp. DG1A-15b TaxID=3052846 RepID=UPI00255C1D7D|nr:hypothetical protein [Amycolatopsis sp. DG1A-15b]WIX92434.1 hypothetical protein QRY02_19135 [Amycolatopsis sp. DG1A-15b]
MRRLRHLGARREQLIVGMVSQIQQIRALLECDVGTVGRAAARCSLAGAEHRSSGRDTISP